MLNNKYISPQIKKKAKIINEMIDVYKDPLFSDFYSDISINEAFSDDIIYYQKNLLKNEKTIEWASGTGRVLIPLIESGYNIKGIEKESEMINKMNKYKYKVTQGDLFDIDLFKSVYKDCDNFILPATTISLFKLNEVINLLKEIIKINKKFVFMFDLIDIEQLITKMPLKLINEKGTFYHCNFKYEESIVYNIFHKETKKLGYSLKYNHKIDNVIKELKKIGLSITVEEKDGIYFDIVGVFNGE